MKEFILLNKNMKILNFEYDQELQLITKVNTIYNEKYLPFGLISENEVDIDKLNKWWKNRQIPTSRKETNFFNDILDTNSYCLSLSDQYWVKSKDNNVNWKDINFFDNLFEDNDGFNSPDYTTNGNYEKRWKIIDGDRYLIKAGSKIINQEPFNEVIATKLYERLLNENEFVKYSLIKDGTREVSMCKNFITKETELVPAWKVNEYFDYLENENSYEHYIRCLNILGIKNARTLIDKMIVCDYILANKDRHFNNFGVIRNVETLEFTSVAPIFDNGCSLWYDENDMYVGEFFLTKPFEEYESKQIGLVKDFSFFEEIKLEGFTKEVENILLTNKLLTKERIDKLVSEIEKRIKYVSELRSRNK